MQIGASLVLEPALPLRRCRWPDKTEPFYIRSRILLVYIVYGQVGDIKPGGPLVRLNSREGASGEVVV